MNEFGNDKCDIVLSDDIGRYVVAAKPLKEGDLLLCEEPVIIGLYWGSGLCCLSCYKKYSKICNKCQLAPLCYDCEHEDSECTFLTTAKLPHNFLIHNFDVITILRFIMLSKNPSKINCYNEVMKMESHCVKRQGTPIWFMHENCVLKPLKAVHMITDKDGPLIQRYCGILDVNAFEVRSDTFEAFPVRGLYPKAALLSHNCVGNTFISLDANKSMRIYSCTDVAVGETIYNNYTFALSLSGTEVRRQHLKEGKYFDCKCRRCEDPTELETHLSSIHCQYCKKGMTVYLVSFAIWRCKLCNKEQSLRDVNDVLATAKSEIIEEEITSVQRLEQLIAKYSELLNPNHYLVIDVKQKLAGVLRHMCDQEFTLQPKLLQRKMELCEDIIPILKVIQPGISRLKAIAFYEYFNSLAELAIHEMNERNISIKEGLVRLSTAEQVAKESIKMLLYEPQSTPEGHLAKSAMLKLKSIRENIRLFQRIVVDTETN